MTKLETRNKAETK